MMLRGQHHVPGGKWQLITVTKELSQTFPGLTGKSDTYTGKGRNNRAVRSALYKSLSLPLRCRRNDKNRRCFKWIVMLEKAEQRNFASQSCQRLSTPGTTCPGPPGAALGPHPLRVFRHSPHPLGDPQTQPPSPQGPPAPSPQGSPAPAPSPHGPQPVPALTWPPPAGRAVPSGGAGSRAP